MLTDRLGVFSGARLGDDEGQQLALLRGEHGGAGVGGVDDRIGLEGGRDLADAHDIDAVVVELQGVAHLERDAGAVRGFSCQLALRTHHIHDDAVAAAEVGELAGDHLRRAADESLVIQADGNAGLKGAIVQAGAEGAFVERHGPVHTGDATHLEHLGFLQGLDVVNVLHLRIDDPDVRHGDVCEEAEGAGHDTGKDGRLLGDEQRGKGEPDDDANVFGAVANEHFQRVVIHQENQLETGRWKTTGKSLHILCVSDLEQPRRARGFAVDFR